MLAMLLTAAIVIDDQAALRASPHDTAPRQAVMWRGDWLEVRGEKAGFVQVYDHRRERPGYVRPSQVRTYPLQASSAPMLHAVVDFLRDTPGAEALGIGYAALYLKAAPAGAVGTEIFDALGTMADRLARRASASRSTGAPGEAALAAHLEVATSYGVVMKSIEGKDRARVCYDGEAFRRVLALGGDAAERARAALALARPGCEPPNLRESEAQALREWRLGVLAKADPREVPAHVANKLRLRRAQTLSDLTYHYQRRGDGKGAATASAEAVKELALITRADVLDEDAELYEEVAVRVGASRWAGEPAGPLSTPKPGVALRIRAGEPGQTCVQLIEDAKAAPKLLHCTYGLVWAASSRTAPRGTALTLAVQPLSGWVELWVFRKAPAEEGGWRMDILAPAPVDPELGYVEQAGWSPDGSRLLVVREALVNGSVHRDFQVLRLEDLTVEKEARSPDRLMNFRNWQSADWRTRTIALR